MKLVTCRLEEETFVGVVNVLLEDAKRRYNQRIANGADAEEGEGEGYILTVLSNDLAGRNDEAIAAIQQISSLTAQWYLQNHGA